MISTFKRVRSVEGSKKTQPKGHGCTLERASMINARLTGRTLFYFAYYFAVLHVGNGHVFAAWSGGGDLWLTYENCSQQLQLAAEIQRCVWYAVKNGGGDAKSAMSRSMKNKYCLTVYSTCCCYCSIKRDKAFVGESPIYLETDLVFIDAFRYGKKKAEEKTTMSHELRQLQHLLSNQNITLKNYDGDVSEFTWRHYKRCTMGSFLRGRRY